MLSVSLPDDCDENRFREVARHCLARGLAPEEVVFTTEEASSLFDQMDPGRSPSNSLDAVHVPRRFLELVPQVLCHRAHDRFALLYRLLWRIHSGDRNLLERVTDPDVLRVSAYAKAVERDVYRMHAYVRFTERDIDGKRVFVAWHEPQHRVVKRAAGFFVDRFTNMDWLIATPLGTAAWRDGMLSFGSPAVRPAEHDDAVLHELWTAYYRVTFNPARLRVKAMVAQMPKRHWPTLPESALIPELIQSAAGRLETMNERGPDAPPRFAAALEKAQPQDPAPAPEAAPLELLRRKAEGCRMCPLHVPATQTVFGEGPQNAAVMFVGEQPGDREDLTGRPFIGPAGQIFDRALAAVGIDRSGVYVTNAVKHFKFAPRGKRRIHSKPGRTEVLACGSWLKGELDLIRPKLVVALGATAMLGLTGRSVAVTKERGRILNLDGLRVLVTVHPSYLLRIPDPRVAKIEFERFVEDLRAAEPWCVAGEEVSSPNALPEQV